ncbi:MAG: family transcriptional regulator, cyclic receptor protein [Solirubrobacteraceae bacterium]|jgi:CRP-like cAMP-binding protein|nr:cyclic nucleotide-binding protein [Solirubrobacterales bacterium]MEA2215427.1 family transcriptional regulator, cyclic receptor protein [Solirubrobacteraceae bacterium]
MAVELEYLRNVRFLAPLKDRDMQRLADSMREHSVAAGKAIVTQGDGAIAFFVLLDGNATVTVDGKVRRTLGPGDHFGEIALVLPDTARTATVTADTDVRLGAMTSWNFKPFIAEHPEVTWPLLETLAQRLADAPGS